MGFRHRTLIELIRVYRVSIPKRGFGGFSHQGVPGQEYVLQLKFQSLRGVLVGFRESFCWWFCIRYSVSIPKRGVGGFSLYPDLVHCVKV